MNRVPFILPVFAVLAFALISVSSERDWLKWLASPIFDFERKWLAPSAVVSVAKANSLTAGYIGYLTAISLSILFRRQVAVGIVDWIKTKVPVVTPGREFTNKSAWIFCLAGFLMADCLVGFFAFQLLPPTPDKRWFLPFCFFILPSGPACVIWLAAFGLNFSSVFKRVTE